MVRQQQEQKQDKYDTIDYNENGTTQITEMVGTHHNIPNNGNNKQINRYPAGMAQIGYACFWPNGGGEQDIEDQRTTSHRIPNDSVEQLDSDDTP